MSEAPSRALRAIEGALTGCAIGDSLGLVREGLSPRRAARLLGPLGHGFFMGRGVVSDDTDHSCLTALAVLHSARDPEAFARRWGRYLAGWLWSAPYGIGGATLRAGVKLSLGFGPARSGVRSAGNGPAMRAPVLGVLLADDPEARRAFVEASARTSHTDPRAIDGAQLVAAGAAELAGWDPGAVDPAAWLRRRADEVETPDLRAALEVGVDALGRGDDAGEVARALGLEGGVSGFVVHTVPMALFVAARHLGDPAAAVEAMIARGGDADTTAAIVGALVGALHGPDAWPADWEAGVVAWPFTGSWRQELAEALVAAGYGPGGGGPGEGPPSVAPGSRLLLLPVRHLVSLPVLLGHVVRRLLPPY